MNKLNNGICKDFQIIKLMNYVLKQSYSDQTNRKFSNKEATVSIEQLTGTWVWNKHGKALTDCF